MEVNFINAPQLDTGGLSGVGGFICAHPVTRSTKLTAYPMRRLARSCSCHLASFASPTCLVDRILLRAGSILLYELNTSILMGNLVMQIVFWPQDYTAHRAIPSGCALSRRLTERSVIDS